MQIVHHIKELKAILLQQKENGVSIGFVPTMGALHEGHLSLVRKCKQSNDITVVSIYVNPAQFNNKNDLKSYPRDSERDCKLLSSEKCNIVFIPDDKEMYPVPDTREFNFGLMEQVMEGVHRTGHFNGVAKIVSKLFEAVEPDKAYFGQKDFQQLAIIRKLVKMNHYDIEIVACPIVREKNGLAMSSRNTLLTKEQRNAAPLIFKVIKEASNNLTSHHSVKSVKEYVRNTINSNKLLKLEYYEIVERNTLKPVSEISLKIPLTACIAVYAGNIRLIDNIDIN
ncbi:MAG: pantoate--beta-alanine ligase [Bacteroidales bacterium]|nr:pantoate--beta-alanine ligase [Bacteroidales bacterium]